MEVDENLDDACKFCGGLGHNIALCFKLKNEKVKAKNNTAEFSSYKKWKIIILYLFWIKCKLVKTWKYFLNLLFIN